MMYILIAIVIGLVFGLTFGDNKPKEKEWKPKKFRPKGRNSTTYPGYTSYL